MITKGFKPTGVVASAVLIICSLASDIHANEPSEPVFNPKISATFSSNSIKLDGVINAEEWGRAEVLSNFVERYPGENDRPDVGTRAFVTYDHDNLYVAFDCTDDPSTLRATMSQRDQFSGDDMVEVLIDTYGDAAWAYEFFANPYGVQKDCLWTNIAGEDTGFDLVWNSAAQITDSGYQVEFAIPFSSMRFPNRDVQSWRINFMRNRPRETFYQYSWAASDRNVSCWPCQWGTVDGIADVQSGRGFEILPTYLAHESGELADASSPNSGFDNGDVMGGLSIGSKYSLASDATLEASYNPDFSQIESDAAQVDVNTTIALLYPERRPFFQEGADVFRTLFNSFYTRTVNDPEWAVKLVSRKPEYTVGFMSAQDENTPYLVPLDESSQLLNSGRSYVNALRVTRPVGRASQVGMILTDRRLEGGGYGTIAALDGNIFLNQSMSIDGQYIASFTGEPDHAGQSESLDGVRIAEGKHSGVFDGERFNGNAMITRLKRFARGWSFILDFNQVEPSYRTLTGYDPWVNYRNGSIWSQYTFYPKNSIFYSISPQMYIDGRWRFDGVRRWEHQTVSLNTTLNWAQTHLATSVRRGSEAWSSRVMGDLIEYRNLFHVDLAVYSAVSDQFQYEAVLYRERTVARFAEAVGWENSADVSITLKPIDRLILEGEIQHVRSVHSETKKELYRQFIARNRLRLQVNRELSLRLVVQYDDSKAAIYLGENEDGPSYYQYADKAWDVDPLVTYRLSSFSVLYAGSTHDFGYFTYEEPVPAKWRLSSRQFFVKLQYLFRV